MFAQHVFIGDLLAAAPCKGDGSERGGEILALKEAGMGSMNCWTPALSTGLGTEEVPLQYRVNRHMSLLLWTTICPILSPLSLLLIGILLPARRNDRNILILDLPHFPSDFNLRR